MDTKNDEKSDKELLELATAYAQMAFHTLKHSRTEITPKSIKDEVKMFQDKFGNNGVIKLANLIMKEKKSKWLKKLYLL